MPSPALLAVLVLLSACASPQPPETEADDVIVGGYGQASTQDEWTKAAQAVAEKEIYARHPTRALVEKVDAQVQVVAGLNYAFDITMTGGARYKVTVYRDLQGGMQVTKFEKVA